MTNFAAPYKTKTGAPLKKSEDVKLMCIEVVKSLRSLEIQFETSSNGVGGAIEKIGIFLMMIYGFECMSEESKKIGDIT